MRRQTVTVSTSGGLATVQEPAIGSSSTRYASLVVAHCQFPRRIVSAMGGRHRNCTIDKGGKRNAERLEEGATQMGCGCCCFLRRGPRSRTSSPLGVLDRREGSGPLSNLGWS